MKIVFVFAFVTLLKYVSSRNSGVNKESDIAKVIVVHNPSVEVKMSNFHPDAVHSIGTIDLVTAKIQHHEMQKIIGSYGAKVYVLRDVLLDHTEESGGIAYNDLIILASKSLIYNTCYARKEYIKLMTLYCTKEQRKSLNRRLREIKPKLETQYQRNYKLEVLRNLTLEELVEIVLTRPIIELHLSHWFAGNQAIVLLKDKMILRPMKSLYFIRDQQITTRKGIVMLNSRVRKGEKLVTEFVLRKLGFRVEGRLCNAFAEGGDYMPFGDLAFFGVGILSDYDAVGELMAKDLFGHSEIAIVHDKDDFALDRMHLDTFFNILDGNGNVLVSEEVLNNTKMRRYVDLYSNKRIGVSLNSTLYGNYVMTEKNVEFGEFLWKRDFKINTVSHHEQVNFATNFLNIGNSTIVTSYCESTYVDKLKTIGITVICVKVDELLKGYGGIHCMTQVVNRQQG